MIFFFTRSFYVIKKLGRFVPKSSSTAQFWEYSLSCSPFCKNKVSFYQGFRVLLFLNLRNDYVSTIVQCTTEHTWRDSYLKVPSWINFFQVVWTLSKCQSNQPYFLPTLLAIFWNYFYIFSEITNF